MRQSVRYSRALLLAIGGIATIFVSRTLLATRLEMPRLFNVFDMLVVLGSIAAIVVDFGRLKRSDWYLSSFLAALVAVGMSVATLFSPHPFFDLVRGNTGQAVLRGLVTWLACLAGLASMRAGGPVRLHLADGPAGKAGRAVFVGLAIGLPLAVANVYALQMSTGRAISWQTPLAALIDAFQPAVVEEIVYRFALWGLLWRLIHRETPSRAVWPAGVLALLVHNFAHLDALFVESPLTALGMGLVTLVLWGIPPTLLAPRRGLEAAIAFHWVQDAARFLAGF